MSSRCLAYPTTSAFAAIFNLISKLCMFWDLSKCCTHRQVVRKQRGCKYVLYRGNVWLCVTSDEIFVLKQFLDKNAYK